MVYVFGRVRVAGGVSGVAVCECHSSEWVVQVESIDDQERLLAFGGADMTGDCGHARDVNVVELVVILTLQ